MNESIISMVGEVVDYIDSVLCSIRERVDADELCEKIKSIPALVVGVEQFMKKNVFAENRKFWDDLCVLYKNCKSMEFIIQNEEVFIDATEALCQELKQMTCLKYRKCVCCGRYTQYIPLDNYYAQMTQKYNAIPHVQETLNEEEYTCNICGAVDRDRLIISFMKKIKLNCASSQMKLLHIAPSKTIDSWIRSNCPSLKYETTDLFMDDVDFNADIQDMSMIEDNTYDYVICSHVLEHVPNDIKAFKELKRIIKDDGVVVFLVPISLDMDCIDEEWGLSSEENWRRFGPDDHCRRYGKQGLLNRMIQNNIYYHEINKSWFGEKMYVENALTDTSTLYLLSKQEISLTRFVEKLKKKVSAKEQPLVSVILPCYNHEKYVDRAIESVINQTYKNIEFVVADDASTDGTVNHLFKYEKHFDKVKYFDNNQQAWDYVKRNSSGKYIAVMHSDDIWENDKIEKQVYFLENNPQYVACFTWSNYVDADGNEMADEIFIQPNRKRYQWLEHFFFYGNCLCHPSLMIYNEKYISTELSKQAAFRQLPDFAKWIKLVQCDNIYIYPENLTYMSRHGDDNTSAITVENNVRTQNEAMYIWYTTIKNMNDLLFKKVFGKYFVNSSAETTDELNCERFFLLAKCNAKYMRMAALFLLYEYGENNDFITCMKNKYGFESKDFAAFSASIN